MQPKTLSEWAVTAGLGEQARVLAASASDPRSFAETLSRTYPEDAVRFLAYLMPNRQGVLWAWSCAKAAAPVGPASASTTSLSATEKWIAQPNDENRRAAMAAAQLAQVGTPAGAAGLAAFLSGESIAPVGINAVPPPEHLASKAVAASIILSAVSSEPEKAPAKYREFLMRGFELAQRTHVWESAPAFPGTE